MLPSLSYNMFVQNRSVPLDTREDSRLVILILVASFIILGLVLVLGLARWQTQYLPSRPAKRRKQCERRLRNFLAGVESYNIK